MIPGRCRNCSSRLDATLKPHGISLAEALNNMDAPVGNVLDCRENVNEKCQQDYSPALFQW